MCYYDYNGDGKATRRVFIGGKQGILTQAAKINNNNLGRLEWSPGLYLAAKSQTDWLTTSSTLVSNHGESNLITRASKYGQIGD
jgi:hypothetical protein